MSIEQAGIVLLDSTNSTSVTTLVRQKDGLENAISYAKTQGLKSVLTLRLNLIKAAIAYREGTK